jgi:hypothetical protein
MKVSSFSYWKRATIELQTIRRELYFFHAVALSLADKAFLIAPPRGRENRPQPGLCTYGFDYLSDELAPLGLASLRLEPYPHALCKKRTAAAVSPAGANLGDVINSVRAYSATAGFGCFTTDAAERDVLS